MRRRQARRPNGNLIKTYKLSRKTILNIVGLAKLVLGKKIWMTWELDLGNLASYSNAISRKNS